MPVKDKTVRSFKIKHVKGMHRFVRELLQNDTERTESSNGQNGLFLAKVQTSTPDGRNIVNDLSIENQNAESATFTNMINFVNRHNIRKNHIYFTTNAKFKREAVTEDVEQYSEVRDKNLSRCIYVDSSNIVYGNGFTMGEWANFENAACDFANNNKPKSLFE